MKLFSTYKRLLSYAIWAGILLSKNALAEATIFTAGPDTPIQSTDLPPQQVQDIAHTTEGAPITPQKVIPVDFRGEARPGEYFVFQVCVYNEAGKKMSVKTSRMRGPDSFSMTCLNTDGGKDEEGNPVTYSLMAEGGKTTVLFVACPIPIKVDKGSYSGTVTISIEGERQRIVPVKLKVTGSPMASSEMRDAPLARLKWISSTAGVSDDVLPPYMPMTVTNGEISILGRSVKLSRQGLLHKVSGNFSSDVVSIDDQSLNCLTSPMLLDVRLDEPPSPMEENVESPPHNADGNTAPFDWTPYSLFVWTNHVAWITKATSPKLNCTVKGTLDYTGCGRLVISLHAQEAVRIKNLNLYVPLSKAVAHYVMCAMNSGGELQGNIKGKDGSPSMSNAIWLGDVPLGIMMQRLTTVPGEKNYSTWVNGDKSGWDLLTTPSSVISHLFTGDFHLSAGESRSFAVEFGITPFRTTSKLPMEKEEAVEYIGPQVDLTAQKEAVQSIQENSAKPCLHYNVHKRQENSIDAIMNALCWGDPTLKENIYLGELEWLVKTLNISRVKLGAPILSASGMERLRRILGDSADVRLYFDVKGMAGLEHMEILPYVDYTDGELPWMDIPTLDVE